MRFISLEMTHHSASDRQQNPRPTVDSVIPVDAIEQVTSVRGPRVPGDDMAHDLGLNVFLTSGRILFLPEASMSDLYLNSAPDTKGTHVGERGGEAFDPYFLDQMLTGGHSAYSVSSPITSPSKNTPSIHEQLDDKYHNVHFDEPLILLDPDS